MEGNTCTPGGHESRKVRADIHGRIVGPRKEAKLAVGRRAYFGDRKPVWAEREASGGRCSGHSHSVTVDLAGDAQREEEARSNGRNGHGKSHRVQCEDG